MFSVILPMDENRLDLWKKTYAKYKEYGIPEGTEFLVISRTIKEAPEGTRLINYEWNKISFNPSKAFNIGIREAKNPYIIMTCPEVMPTSNVLEQLKGELGNNVICQVYDQAENGSICMSLVNSGFRNETPAMYFLALFNKKDIEKINGWDEEFMNVYAWEDSDFGERWNRAGLPFKVRDDITAIHQYHHRGTAQPEGYTLGMLLFEKNKKERVIRPKNGLVKEE